MDIECLTARRSPACVVPAFYQAWLQVGICSFLLAFSALSTAWAGMLPEEPPTPSAALTKTIDPITNNNTIATATAIVAATISMASFFLASLQARKFSKDLELKNRIDTINFVSNQFDRLVRIGARDLYNEARAFRDVKDFLGSRGNIKREQQLMLEYVYTYNRIGFGIYGKTLSEEVVFNIWAPSYFIKNWSFFQSLVKEKRTSNEYSYFDWLGAEYCPTILNLYPAKKPKAIP